MISRSKPQHLEVGGTVPLGQPTQRGNLTKPAFQRDGGGLTPMQARLLRAAKIGKVASGRPALEWEYSTHKIRESLPNSPNLPCRRVHFRHVPSFEGDIP